MIVYVNGKKYRLKGISLAVVMGTSLVCFAALAVALAYLPFFLFWMGV